MMKSLLSTRTRTTYCVSISILEADTVQAFAAASASVAPTRARSVSENVVLLHFFNNPRNKTCVG